MGNKSIEIVTAECCSYGCGNVAKYVNKSGSLMCCQWSNSCPALREKNSLRVYESYASGKRPRARMVYDSLPEDTKARMAWNKGKNPGTVFAYGVGGNHKNVLLKERGHICESCNLDVWLGTPIPLELEHIDGDNKNNVRENLKLLCPNCHALTPTWKGRNATKKKTCDYVSDADFTQALKTSKNIRQALFKVGLTPKGANYDRAYSLLCKIGATVNEENIE